MKLYETRKKLSEDESLPFVGMSPMISHLLFHRGIESRMQAEQFLNPDYDRDLHDPFLLKDAEKAAKRIVDAIRKGEKIAIYSDYDADGIPGAVMFHDFFTRIGFANFVIYIPHRHDEGFGLNVDAVESLAQKDVSLLVTVDCGITDSLAVDHANSRGMDVIITDHHEPPEVLPKAFAVVDHKQKNCEYPDKNLCGSGVGFKLIQGILKIERFGLKEGHEKWLLDMVGIATLSDMVPLTGENRVLAYFGLKVLRMTQRKGFKSLLDRLKMSQSHLSEDDIAFMITPRINAASRMGVPMDAFHLLTAKDDESAVTYAVHLDGVNNERKGIVASLVKEIKKVIRERHGEKIPNVIVLGNPEWRPSLLGLVANSCAQEFKRPVFLWGRDGDNVIKGSCRSEGVTDLVGLMRASVSDTFLQFGGHKFSGGFAVGGEGVHTLHEKLNVAFETLSQSFGDKTHEIEIVDLSLSLDDLDNNIYDDVSRLSPFGIGNPRPVFIFKKIKIDSVKKFGKTGDHIELIFKKKSGQKISAISFFGSEGDWAKQIKDGDVIDLVASLEKSFWKGRTESRLRVFDVIYSSYDNSK